VVLAPERRPVGGEVGADGVTAAEQIGMASGLGAAVTLLAGMAIGRFSVRGTRDVAAALRQESERRWSRSEPDPSSTTASSVTPPRWSEDHRAGKASDA
jgi:hypothetical protein